MTAREFLNKALVHYTDKLNEICARYEIMSISDTFIEHGSSAVVSEDGAGALWKDISTKSGINLQVDYVDNDPQSVYAILSKKPLEAPTQTHLLWALVQFLMKKYDESEKIEALDFYEGPYKLEIPKSVYE